MNCVIRPKNGSYLTSKDFEQWQDYFSNLLPPIPAGIFDPDADQTDLRVKNITFVVTEQCNLACKYCLPAGTKVLDAKFNEVNIEDLQVGNDVLGFDEFISNKGSHKKIYPTRITKTYSRKSPCLKITLDNGKSIDITENHPILDWRGLWKTANVFKVGDTVKTFPVFNYVKTDPTSLNYKIGYVVAMMLGDGSYNHYLDKNGYDVYKIRLAVKDDEIIERMSAYLKELQVNFYLKPFKISTKYNLYKDAIFANTKTVYDQIINLIENNFGKNQDVNYLSGFLAGIYDAEGSISRGIIRICNSNDKVIQEIERACHVFDIPYRIEPIKNCHVINVRILNSNGFSRELNSLRFIKTIHPAIKRKESAALWDKSFLTHSKILAIENAGEKEVYNIETNSHTYIANNVAVHNCYETHKTGKVMS